MRIRDRSPSLWGTRKVHYRSAFTLVELLVAIIIVGILAGLAVLIIPRLQDSQRVATAAERVQGQLYIAKQMALRDQLPRGVRLVQGSNPLNPYYDPNNPNANFTTVQLIEQPAPYTTGVVTNVVQDPATNNWWAVTFTGANFGNNAVLPGDYLDLSAANDTYCTSSPGAMHYIGKVDPANGIVWVVTPPGVNPGSFPPPWGYRIIRSPRPLIGEKPLNLPIDVVVYLPGQGYPSSYVPLDSDGNYDIMFDPTGKLIRAAGSQGKVVLWVGDPTPNSTAGGDTLIAVYARTGVITTQPAGPPSDPYQYIENGATSGM